MCMWAQGCAYARMYVCLCTHVCVHTGGIAGVGVSAIGITTNGITLARKLPQLKARGLTHVNISLDTFDKHKFTIITRRNGVFTCRARACSLVCDVLRRAWCCAAEH